MGCANPADGGDWQEKLRIGGGERQEIVTNWPTANAGLNVHHSVTNELIAWGPTVGRGALVLANLLVE